MCRPRLPSGPICKVVIRRLGHANRVLVRCVGLLAQHYSVHHRQCSSSPRQGQNHDASNLPVHVSARVTSDFTGLTCLGSWCCRALQSWCRSYTLLTPTMTSSSFCNSASFSRNASPASTLTSLSSRSRSLSRCSCSLSLIPIPGNLSTMYSHC